MALLLSIKAQEVQHFCLNTLKRFAEELAVVFQDIICASILERKYPTLYKHALVSPVPKVHPPEDFETDFRQISVLTCPRQSPWDGTNNAKQGCLQSQRKSTCFLWRIANYQPCKRYLTSFRTGQNMLLNSNKTKDMWISFCKNSVEPDFFRNKWLMVGEGIQV